MFEAFADVDDLSDKDDLGNDQRVDQGEGIVPEGNIVFLEQERGVGGKGAEEERQIDEDIEQFPGLVLGLLL